MVDSAASGAGRLRAYAGESALRARLARVQPARLTQAPPRRAKGKKTRAQAVIGKGERGRCMLSHARRMGSVQRIAHKIRGIRRVLFLNLLFCDSFEIGRA